MISLARHGTLSAPSSAHRYRFSPLPIIRNAQRDNLNFSKYQPLSPQKPICISAAETLGAPAPKPRKPQLETRAYEAADRPLEISIERPGQQAAQRVKIGIYFATWWALNVVFNIYNKKVLNAFPYPWLTSTLSLAAGSLMMLASWATRVAETPKVDLEFWKMLLPVSDLRNRENLCFPFLIFSPCFLGILVACVSEFSFCMKSYSSSMPSHATLKLMFSFSC